MRRTAMTLIPRDSLFDLDNLFNHFFTPTVAKELDNEFFSPRVDIKEAKDKYEIIADLPGVAKDDLSVTLENGVLSIEASTSGKRRKSDSQGTSQWKIYAQL
jgi:HSP20 family protein